MMKGTNTKPIPAVELPEAKMAFTEIAAAAGAPDIPATSANRDSGRVLSDSLIFSYRGSGKIRQRYCRRKRGSNQPSHSTRSERGPRNEVFGRNRSFCPGVRRILGKRFETSSSTTLTSKRASGAPMHICAP